MCLLDRQFCFLSCNERNNPRQFYTISSGYPVGGGERRIHCETPELIFNSICQTGNSSIQDNPKSTGS